jgi:carbonic anhydrase/acetyltransferase-like protein (isoleucine patch superfamily)
MSDKPAKFGLVTPFEGTQPVLGNGAWVAPGAHVMGDVVLGADASVWYNSVVRGDVHRIRIGARTNIQDLSLVHIDTGTAPTHIGDDVTVGHKAIIHGCTIEDRCLIGMGAIILSGAHIAEECLVGAGSLVPPGKSYPRRSLLMGSPARVVREVTDEEVEAFLESARHYAELAKRHMTGE